MTWLQMFVIVDCKYTIGLYIYYTLIDCKYFLQIYALWLIEATLFQFVDCFSDNIHGSRDCAMKQQQFQH